MSWLSCGALRTVKCPTYLSQVTLHSYVKPSTGAGGHWDMALRVCTTRLVPKGQRTKDCSVPKRTKQAGRHGCPPSPRWGKLSVSSSGCKYCESVPVPWSSIVAAMFAWHMLQPLAAVSRQARAVSTGATGAQSQSSNTRTIRM